MEIDIISYTEEQYAALSDAQLLEIQEAQLKKDRLQTRLTKNLQKEKDGLIEKGMYDSGLYALIEAELTSAYEQEVEAVRQSLLFYLHYTAKPNGDVSAPYVVNYALSDVERFSIVKEYYESTYTDTAERFSAFKKDLIAKSYLGEMYEPLYIYFRDTVEE